MKLHRRSSFSSRWLRRLTAAGGTLLAAVAGSSAVVASLAGCAKSPTAGWVISGPGGSKVSAWQLETAAPAAALVVPLAAAGNEWTSFTVELTNLPPAVGAGQLAVALAPLAGPSPLPLGAQDVEVFQIVDVPADATRATAVRHAGQTSSARRLPRALLPLTADGGRFDLRNLKPPVASAASAGAAGSPASQPVSAARLWVDLHLPANAPAGRYTTACQLLTRPDPKAGDWQVASSLPVELTVHNFSLPDRRNLLMVGQVSWDSLVRHYADDFEAVSPHLVNRGEAKYAGTVRTLDALSRLAHQNRASVVFPRLQPTVKWPAMVNDAPPEVRWDDFDAVVGPWLSGKAFGDASGGGATGGSTFGVGYWPLPEPDHLRSYDTRSRLAYWNLAASHFDRNDWLGMSAVQVEKVTPGRPRGAEAIELSVTAAQLLAAHPRMDVAVPLEEQQVQLADAADAKGAADGKGPADAAVARADVGGAKLVDPRHAGRLRVAAAGLIGVKPTWPDKVDEPKRWLRTDLPGLVPLPGLGGREPDVRQWAWLAFLRRADHVLFADPLPAQRTLAEAADPSDLTWFYPGRWFGVDGPVPTVQLKWLRQAEQDYEYLHLAKLKGEAVDAFWMARLITKPVEVALGQAPDDAYTLMTGTTDPKAWADARGLLAKVIGLYAGRPDGTADRAAKEAAEIEILGWARPQEKPLLIARQADWSWAPMRDGARWVNLTVGLDVYNAADVAPGDNRIQWDGLLPAGWEVKPQADAVPPLVPYQVLRTGIGGQFNVGKAGPKSRQPVGVELVVDSPTARFASRLRVSLPVAACDRREGRFSLDGKLNDWLEADQIHDGPLVKMLSRPAVLAQALEPASTSSKLYTNFGNEGFYVGFALAGLAGPEKAVGGSRNFVDYQARRAWGEDLCQVLIQPIYHDNAVGPVLHVVCKPNGSIWVERKLDPRFNADPWEPFESTGTRYAADVVGDKWTGELAIPWRVLQDPKRGLPELLRFNFAQHRSADGESASWAGPVDFGRDDALTGLLHVKLPVAGNPGDAVQGEPGWRGPAER
jgi:hypothetical protein